MNTTSLRQITASYIYEDYTSVAIARIDRIEPGRDGQAKEFLPYLADSSGSFSSRPGLNSIKLPLYHLPEVIKTAASGGKIILVEGEGKCDQLVMTIRNTPFKDVAITSLSNGARTPMRIEHIEAFRGSSRVVVIADSDIPGRDAAKKRANQIREVVEDVRILDLFPERTDGSDIADFINEGNSIDNLRRLIDALLPIPYKLDKNSSEDAASITHVSREIQWQAPRAWPMLHEKTLYGPVGDAVRLLAPTTEADPAALLFTLLVSLGNIAGNQARVMIGNDSHPARLFVVIIGDSSKGAKGTSYTAASGLLKLVAPDWYESRRMSGFASGEGVIAEFIEPNDDSEAQSMPDKRCFIKEGEFARTLTSAARDGSTLSAIMRDAWDGETLQIRRAKDRIIAKNVHLSILGHITPQELKLKLTESDMFNGFANRFLYVCSKRSKKLPFGGHPPHEQLVVLAEQIASAIERSRNTTFGFTPEAEVAWDSFYHQENDRTGVLAPLTARVAPQCLRLAVTYAILDATPTIHLTHVEAARACWEYSLASAEHTFGDLRENATQGHILALLQEVYPEGLTITELHNAFRRNLKGESIKAACDTLIAAGLVLSKRDSSKPGRPATCFFALPFNERNELNEESNPTNDLNSLTSFNSLTSGRLKNLKGEIEL